MLKSKESKTKIAAQPQSSTQSVSDQHLEQLVAKRTQELEQVIKELRARQFELEAQANHDCLTGLATRRLLQDRFQCAVERARRSGTSFALVVMDLDGFKNINDTYGHAAGDQVLVETARRITATLRTSDTAARLGGDEFALIVECLSDSHAMALVCKKLKAAVARAMQLEIDFSVNVDASVGIAMYPAHGEGLEQLLGEADQRMYVDKAEAHAVAHGAAALTPHHRAHGRSAHFDA